VADTSDRSAGRADWWTRATTIANLIIAVAAVTALYFTAHQLRAQQNQFDEQRKQFSYATSLDALWKLDEEWDSTRMQAIRRAAATDLAAKRDDTDAVDEVLDFFDLVGLMVARQVVDTELVWHEFAYLAPYEQLTRQHVADVRRDNKTVWEDMVSLVPKLDGIEAKHLDHPVTNLTLEELQDFLTTEQRLGVGGAPPTALGRHRHRRP
jgi:hypothetical protein